MPAFSTWPADAESRRLAAELLADVATAPAEIATAFLELLTEYLQRKFPAADPDLCATAAADAVFATIRRQNHYDPARLELGAFLRMVAARDLQNLLAREWRHRRTIPLESVAEPADRGNSHREDAADEPSWDDPRLVATIAAFDPAEKLALDLMRAGERSTTAFARVVGLSAGSADELAAVVKRLKDRLKRRLSRAVGGDA